MTTKKERKRIARDKMYQLNVDMNKAAKSMLASVTNESLQKIMAAHMSILVQKDQGDSVSIEQGTLQQMACLASVTLSRILMERFK